MSLNGLDDAKVLEAHAAAAIEPGGWFLLKYANRDEVELYNRGNGGIVDIRGAIAKYDETSPLYGFLRYRRRNVILKYQPEDCSRLVQARAAVHFNAICDRFAPYDTTFEISIAKDLKDSKLSAACSLHAASGSASSSSSSLRRRRLNEIAEEEEEEERERKRQSTVKEEDKRASVYSVPDHSPSSPEQRAVLDRKQITSPQGTNFASTADVPKFTGAERPTSPAKSETAPRLSSQSTRPELYSYSTYAYGKPKVKLGPRPSLDVNKRPSTAGNFRPIAALPAGFKFFSKGSKKGHSQESEQAEEVDEAKSSTAEAALTVVVPIPEAPQDASHHLPVRPATSSGASIKSTNQSSAPISTSKEAKMTPEKARLMKAMKLREKKKMMSSALAKESTVAGSTEEKEGGDVESKDSLRIKGDVTHRTVSHADSGIAIDPPTPMTINTEDISDSHPNSPTAATSSEIGVSTKASSLSESTDETIPATKDTLGEAKGLVFQQHPKDPCLPEMDGALSGEGESSSRTNQETGLPVEKSARQKASVGPIRTDLTKTTPRSEASDPLLDDALMDELQSATLQEAKPMFVSKSPITPVFPNTGPGPQLSRTVSNPMRGPHLAPGDVSQSSARSVSAGGATYLNTVNRQPSNAGLQPKKNNIGSSISQRIKALEKLSGSTGPEDVRPRTAAPSSTFFSVRKQNVREPSRSPSVVDRASSLTRQTPTPEQSREVTPETPNAERRERSLSVASRLSMFEMHPPTSQTSPRGRPESIQVTARIIRDPSQSLPRKPDANANAGDYPQLELKQSPLIVDLQRTEEPQPIPEPEKTPLAAIAKETIQERRDKKSTSDDGEKKSRRSSLSIVKDFIKDRRSSNAGKSTDNLAFISPNGAKSPSRPPSAHQNAGGLARRLSISSRRSSLSRERDSSIATPIASPAVLSDSGSERDDKSSSDKKSKNRASRFMRRLSNSLAGGRKNSSPHISPTVAEEDADQLAAASTTDVSLSSQPAVVAYLGDVNVQFPDNLLWKRRSMCLDTQGNLFLNAVQGVATGGKDKASGVGMKRYHLSDFRMPYIPDVEVQELPNSVVLDLVEGSCLQIACEDRAGQLNVLNTLQDAHQSHNSFGQ
ncbi:hypothetical protein F5Y05DRAFT_401076 [Hypoxylon sp. FL0543]|nr:hypothetical protein F5Y05DRAFT_401076 [Hypoxylon sp. FL0543]